MNNSKYKELRKEEAASVIPDYNNEQLVHCLGLIYCAPKSKNKDERREILLRWTQCTRSERVTMFMTKSEMQQFTTDKGIYSEMKWSRSVKLLRQDLASLLSRLEYSDYNEAVDVEEGENG